MLNLFKTLYSLIFWGLVIITNSGYAQTYTLKGTVVDSLQQPVPFANVYTKSLKHSTTSDTKGAFKLDNLPHGDYILVISFQGFKTFIKKIHVDGDIDFAPFVLQDMTTELEKVFIESYKSMVTRKDAPVQSSLLKAKSLRATQSISLLDGMNFQPALRTENTCGNCGSSGLRINGLESEYSQILIDGQPIFTNLQAVYGLEQIPAFLIDRIEVVKGGGSATYGSGSVAGTINVITKEPTDNKMFIEANEALVGGKASDFSAGLGGSYRMPSKKVGVLFNAFHRNRREWDANDDGFTEIPKLNTNNVHAKVMYYPSSSTIMSFQVFNLHSIRRGGNKLDLPFHKTDLAEGSTHYLFNGATCIEHISKNSRHRWMGYGSFQHLKREGYYGANQDPNAYGRTLENNLIAGAKNIYNLSNKSKSKQTLISGVEIINNILQDSSPGYNREVYQPYSQYSAFVQHFVEVGKKFNLLVGGRLDRHSQIERLIFNPRINMFIALTPSLSLKGGYTRGFKAPQIFSEDLHISQVNGQALLIQNQDDLRPELSNTWNASVEWKWSYANHNVEIVFDGFNTQLMNIFKLEELPNSQSYILTMQRRNGNQARVRGVSISPKYKLQDVVEIQSSITWQLSNYDSPQQWSAFLENNSTAFLRTPSLYGYYLLTYNLKKSWSLNLSGVYTGSMLVPHFEGHISQDRLEESSPFFEHNFKIDYKVPTKGKANYLFSIGIQNYTNSFQTDIDRGASKDAAYVYGPSRPRTHFVALKMVF